MKMTHQTKGGLPPRGKKYIFVHAAGEDRALSDRLSDRLLALPRGAGYCLWRAEDPEAVFQEAGSPEFLSMQVFVPLVTEAYLSLCGRKGAGKREDGGSFLSSLMERGVAVLPVFDRPETVTGFNDLFGNIHGIFLNSVEADRLLAAQLDRFLPDDELTERIMREAFAGRIFLSYRKTDVAEAIRVMRAIHDTDAARRAAIWFDEFLVAGRDFDEEIRKMLASCDAMALVVTPNLVRKGNYVLEKEYPEAVRRGKKLIPVRARETDARAVASEIPEAGEPADADDRGAMEAIMEKAGFHAGGDMGPLALYLLGMAFLSGIGVEKDEKRALGLLEASADADCVEACEEMGFLYLAGIAVKRDHDRSLEYKLKAYRLLMGEPPSARRTDRLYRLLFERDGLCLLMKSRDRCGENRTIARAFLDGVDEVDDGSGKYVLYRAEALNELADLHFDPPGDERTDEAIDFARKALELLEGYEGDKPDEAQYLRAVAFGLTDGAYWRKGDMDTAISWAERAKECIAELEQRTRTVDHKETARNISMALGTYYYDRGCALTRADMNPLLSIARALPAVRELTDTMERSRELMEIAPTINNREGMALTLFNYGRSLPLGRDRRRCFAEAYGIILKLQEVTGDGSFDDLAVHLAKPLGFLAKRRIRAGKPVEPITMERVRAILREKEELAAYGPGAKPGGMA